MQEALANAYKWWIDPNKTDPLTYAAKAVHNRIQETGGYGEYAKDLAAQAGGEIVGRYLGKRVGDYINDRYYGLIPGQRYRFGANTGYHAARLTGRQWVHRAVWGDRWRTDRFPRRLPWKWQQYAAGYGQMSEYGVNAGGRGDSYHDHTYAAPWRKRRRYRWKRYPTMSFRRNRRYNRRY